jgi:Zn-finger nucleic acid-binding protein
MMVGLCYICGKPALDTCTTCGQAVCEEHVNTKTGICVRCGGVRLSRGPFIIR